MENKFIRADDVAQELNVSKPYAYKLIHKLNEACTIQVYILIVDTRNSLLQDKHIELINVHLIILMRIMHF